MKLTEFLVKKEIIDKDRAKSLEEKAKSSNQKIEEIILNNKIVSEDILFSAKSENLKVPLKNISEIEMTQDLLKLVPEETAVFYQMIPLAKRDDEVEIGMVYPEDLKAKEALKFLLRKENLSATTFFLITPSTLNSLLRKYKSFNTEVTEAINELEQELKTEKIESKEKESADLEDITEEAPISRVVTIILNNAVEQRASDIHVEPLKDKLRVRFRIDGTLRCVLTLPVKVLPAIVSRIKILATLKIDETRVPQDGRFSATINEKAIDFRVAILPTTLGEKVVLRILDSSQGTQNFEKLGFQGRNLEIINQAIKKPFGLILVTGPTGSGKTTTLYAVLSLLNKEGVNIVTLEDPAEYFIEGVNQSQVKPEIGYDFASGLRQILRQDPNVVMVGEIRDEETANLAVQAALTGHIVLSTLHTNNALGVIPRLIDLGVKPYLISPSLVFALAQRLVKRLCPECRKQIKPEKGIEELIKKELDAFPQFIKKTLKIPDPIMVYEPVGCKVCNNSGYKGRVAIYEILEMTKSLGDTILKDLSEVALQREATSQGMTTMRQDGILKVLEGITSIEEIIRVTSEE